MYLYTYKLKYAIFLAVCLCCYLVKAGGSEFLFFFLVFTDSTGPVFFRPLLSWLNKENPLDYQGLYLFPGHGSCQYGDCIVASRRLLLCRRY